jgi:hypothetical protein
MRDKSLKEEFEASVVAPRVDGVNILGNIVNGEVLQFD